MKNWFILTFAVCCEGMGSIALKEAQHDKLWFILTLASDGIAFALLALLLRRGMGLSVVYGIWGAMGVALTALLGTVMFNEPFTGVMGLGIALVVVGVLLVEAGSDAGEAGPSAETSNESAVTDSPGRSGATA